jgi:hypothetical protein
MQAVWDSVYMANVKRRLAGKPNHQMPATRPGRRRAAPGDRARNAELNAEHDACLDALKAAATREWKAERDGDGGNSGGGGSGDGGDGGDSDGEDGDGSVGGGGGKKRRRDDDGVETEVKTEAPKRPARAEGRHVGDIELLKRVPALANYSRDRRGRRPGISVSRDELTDALAATLSANAAVTKDGSDKAGGGGGGDGGGVSGTEGAGANAGAGAGAQADATDAD